MALLLYIFCLIIHIDIYLALLLSYWQTECTHLATHNSFYLCVDYQKHPIFSKSCHVESKSASVPLLIKVRTRGSRKKKGMKATETSGLNAWLIKRRSDHCGRTRIGPGSECPSCPACNTWRGSSITTSACHTSAIRILRREALPSAALCNCHLSCQPFFVTCC